MLTAVSRELAALLSSPHTTQSQAADAIEEHIIHRRSKGDTLHDVSTSLSLMEGKSPRLVPAIRQAQYVTNVPPASGANEQSQAPSSTPTAVLAYLLAEPMPPVHLSRKVLLEYVLSREARLREKKHGRGGKGTLGREGFEDLADRMGEIEEGLRGTGPLAHASRMSRPPVADEDLSPSRQMGLALVLSIRMLLSYFTLPDLAKQLLLQTPQDAERTLVQHIRRRVAGEGRYAVGRELEYVESLTLNRRPALRPAFRSARNRTQLPPIALYPITLPAPSKSSCIKMLTAFVREVEQAGPAAATSYQQTGPLSPGDGERSFRPRKMSPRPPAVSSFGSSPSSPSPGSSPQRGGQAGAVTDSSPLENYTIELLSEYLMREKREYMLRNKWVKVGREQLSKDLGDIEVALCTSGKNMTPSSPALLPAFLLLRRTFALPSSPLPARVTEQYFQTLPSPPDPDSVPLREPTVSSTTAMLYVNPRLPDDVALDAIEELIENEREKGMNAAISQEKTIAWLNGLVDQVEKRFPDGTYEAVLDRARYIAAHPRVWPDASIVSPYPGNPLPPTPTESAGHRRTKSSAHPSISSNDEEPYSARERLGSFHSRSASMPMRSSMQSSVYDESPSGSPVRNGNGLPSLGQSSAFACMTTPFPVPYGFSDAASAEQVASGSSHSPTTIGKSADSASPERHGLSGLGFGGISRSKAPPTLNLFVPGPELDIGLSTVPTPPSGGRFSINSREPNSAASASGGWWDVVSTGEASPAGRVAPWASRSSNSPSSAGSLVLDSPTSAGPASSMPFPMNLTPQMDFTPKLNGGSPNNTPPKPYDSPITPQIAQDSPRSHGSARSHGSTPTTGLLRKPVPIMNAGATPPASENLSRSTGYEESDFRPSYDSQGLAADADQERLRNHQQRISNYEEEESDRSPDHHLRPAFDAGASSSHSRKPSKHDDFSVSYNDYQPSYNSFNSSPRSAPLARDPMMTLDALSSAIPHSASAGERGLSREDTTRTARGNASSSPEYVPSSSERLWQAHSRQLSQSHAKPMSQTHSRQPSQTHSRSHSRQPSQAHNRQPSRSRAGLSDEAKARASSEASRPHSEIDDLVNKDVPPLPPMPSMPSMPMPMPQFPQPQLPQLPPKNTPSPPAPAAVEAPPREPTPEPEPETEPEPIPEPDRESAAQSAARAEALSRLLGPSKPQELSPPPAPVPPPEPELTEEQEDLYASLDFMPTEYKSTMSKKPAGAFSHTQHQQPGLGHARSVSKTNLNLTISRDQPMVTPNRSAPKSATSQNDTFRWPRRRPSEANAMPVDTSPPDTIDEFGVAPKSAPGMPASSSTWPKVEDGTRSADGHDVPHTAPMARAAGRPVPVAIDRPGFPSRSRDQREQATSPTESRGKFNLSSMMSRAPKLHKENTAAAHAPQQQAPRRPPVSNHPGRWNRNMVMDIMGPPKAAGVRRES